MSNWHPRRWLLLAAMSLLFAGVGLALLGSSMTLGSDTATIRIPDAQIAPGGTETVTLEALNVPDPGACMILVDVIYDPGVKTATSCVPDPDGRFANALCNLVSDRVALTVSRTADGVTGDFPLATITWEAVGDPGEWTLLDVDIRTFVDCVGTDIPVDDVDGENRIVCPNDEDKDGVCDGVDDCPDTPSEEDPDEVGCSDEQVDGDGDGYCDPDAPSDGPSDCQLAPADNCPDVPNPGQANNDGDTLGDACDNCPNTTNQNQNNNDDDDLGDACDNCPNTTNQNQNNTDDDDLGDACDNCPNTTNQNQNNSDGDDLGDACDNCPNTTNQNQDNSDGDDLGDACDNCPNTTNQNQANNDGDDLGDACDNCPNTTNQNQNNNDDDSYGDACDNCPNTTNQNQANNDDDSYGDACDNCPTVDNEDQANEDGDEWGDACDDDDDNDGASDAVEKFYGSDPLDPDSTPEALGYDQTYGATSCEDDIDNDGDGTMDENESDGSDPDTDPDCGVAALPGVAMLAGWNDKCYIGDEMDVQDALSGIADKVLAIYILNESQVFDHWFPDRSDINTIDTLQPYDQLFVLMSAAGTWSQTPSTETQPSVSLIEGWNSICYTGQTKPIEEATSEIAEAIGILYKFLDATQKWTRYVPDNADVSTISTLTQLDSVFVLITQEGGITWVFDP